MSCNFVAEIEQKLLVLESSLNAATAEIENLKKGQEKTDDTIGTIQSDISALEEKVLPGKIAASCDELAQRGETQSGEYQIKPTIDIEPFTVTCDFSEAIAKTIISHDHGGYGITSTPGQSDGCEDAGK